VSGNDIVDLATAAVESNWRRKGFLEKIFTQQEQEYVKHAAAPDEMVWRLWTMKESAYKIHTGQYGGRFFAPQKLSCIISTDIAGTVNIDTFSYHTITTCTGKYIYSIATGKHTKAALFLNCCFMIPGLCLTKQQQFIYEKIICRYTKFTGTEKTQVAVRKNNMAVPFLYIKSDNSQIPVSITHHGLYAAFTI
jgi:phosphopantetheinyl transferase (holo-ACP synthase)